MKTQESAWQSRLKPAAEKIFAELRAEHFTHGEIEAIAGALEQESARHVRADLFRRWRQRRELSLLDAARTLGLAVEDVEAIEAGTLQVGPEAFRAVRRALRRMREDLHEL